MPVLYISGSVAAKTLEADTLHPSAEELHQVTVSEEHLLWSIATSLKRIADSLEKPTLSLPDSLHSNLTDIAWEAGRSFKAGMEIGR